MAFVLLLAAYLLVRAYLHWSDPDREYKLINFAAAWFPFAVSIFVAFIPDFEKAERMRPIWRVGIIAVGLAYSVILWYQQSVNVSAARHDQEVTIEKSDEHADQKFNDLQKHLDLETSKSTGQVESVQDGLSDLMNQMQANLNKRIGEVGKPVPPELAKLQFSLWNDSMKSTDFPILSEFLKRGPDMNVTIDFTFTDISSTAADSTEVMVLLCSDCTFTSEPSGFTKLNGAGELQRHRLVGDVNPGTIFEKMTLSVKVPLQYNRFDVGFNYACKTCGKPQDWQKLTVNLVP